MRMNSWKCCNKKIRCEGTTSQRFSLQGIVFLIVFGKIQSFRLGRDPLAWIVLELQALMILGYGTPFGAEDLLVVDPGAEAAVGAGFLDALSEEHVAASRFCLLNGLYTIIFRNAIPFFTASVIIANITAEITKNMRLILHRSVWGRNHNWAMDAKITLDPACSSLPGR